MSPAEGSAEIPCFSLLDEIFARSLPFEVVNGTHMTHQHWDAVEELVKSTKVNTPASVPLNTPNVSKPFQGSVFAF